MSRLRRACLVLVAALAAPLATSEMASFLPQGIPQPGALAEWKRAEGRVALGDGRSLSYVLYVDPRYPALYRLTRYQVTIAAPASAGGVDRRREEEKVVWNGRPGSREPLLCYTLAPAVEVPARWEVVPPGSEAYLTAMQTAILIYVEHARQGHRGSPE